MRTENGKIVEITENELYSLWLKRGMDDIMSFTDYMFRFEELGTKIIRGKLLWFGNTGSSCTGSGRRFHCGKGMDVLVHKGCSEKNQFRRADGRCVASPFRRTVFHRCINRYFRFKNGISGYGCSGKSHYMYIHWKSCIRYFQGCNWQDGWQILPGGSCWQDEKSSYGGRRS